MHAQAARTKEDRSIEYEMDERANQRNRSTAHKSCVCIYKCSIKKNYTYGFASSCRCDSKQNINEKLFHKGYGYAQINLNSLMMRHTVKYLQRAIITQLQNTKSYFMRYLIC